MVKAKAHAPVLTEFFSRSISASRAIEPDAVAPAQRLS